MINLVYKNFFSRNSFITCINLYKWGLVTVFGKDCMKYLNDQFTINIYKLSKRKYIHCAHCNINGKVWTNLLLFHYNNNYAYIARKSVLNVQVKKLKKYAIFSKVNIKYKKKIFLFSCIGINVKLFLLKFFKILPNKYIPVINKKKITILWFKKPKERFLFIVNKSQILFFKNIFNNFINLNSNQWSFLNFKYGFPIIDIFSMNKFFPQSINLYPPKNIHMNKGCYLGQEIISKMIFKKINKGYLYILKVFNKFSFSKFKNKTIRFLDINNKIIVGNILSTLQFNNNIIFIQIVLNKNISVNSILIYKNSVLIKFFVQKKF